MRYTCGSPPPPCDVQHAAVLATAPKPQRATVALTEVSAVFITGEVCGVVEAPVDPVSGAGHHLEDEATRHIYER